MRKVWPWLAVVWVFFTTIHCHAQAFVSGSVYALPDSTPLPGVALYIASANVYTETDAKGSFQFPATLHPAFKFQIYKTGYVSQLLENSVPSANWKIYLKPNVNDLEELVIYGNQEELKSGTANNIDVIGTDKMRELGALNLSDGMAKLPGVSQLNTGPGISKPVIRGLNGNRIQTVLFGIRFDNQQWQDEHGLGLSDVGIDRVEILKGPSTLFYGSEAMGGVINIIGEKPAKMNSTESSLSSRYFSNTNGYAVDAGVKKSRANSYLILRAGYESHGDYSDGDNKRILNSRFGGQMFKASYGWRRKNWQSENTYLFGLNHFGFLMDAYQLYDKADARWSRSFERPHHTVLLNLFTSKNSFEFKSSKLQVNAGVHFNNRQEQEGSAGISLNMLLNTYALALTWSKSFNTRNELSIGSQHQWQTNENIGSRIIVPDATLGESALFTYVKRKSKHAVSEVGLRYDLKRIDTRLTGSLNTASGFNPGKNIIPVNRLYQTLNACAGISVFDSKHWNVKANLSSGYRAPNLAELSSNGLHEGSVRYELGNVDLKTEQNICMDAYVSYTNAWLSLYADAYINRFYNYIYLQATNREYIGFTIYDYKQQNALLSGVEGGLKIHPGQVKNLQLNSVYSSIVGQTDDHHYLPFIPAQKINSECKVYMNARGKWQNAFFSVVHQYVFAQGMVSEFENRTEAYQLVNLSAGAERRFKRVNVKLSSSLNNALNESYYDHLSRFKYFGIYNIGRNLGIHLTLQFI